MIEIGEITPGCHEIQTGRDRSRGIELPTHRPQPSARPIAQNGRAVGATDRVRHAWVVELWVGECDQRHRARTDTSAVSSQPLELSRAAERNDHALRR